MNELVAERCRLFCISAMERLDLECAVNELSPTKTGCVVLFCKETLSQCMRWLNEFIILKKPSRDRLTLPEMYRFFAVFICSHTTGLSYTKTIEVLRCLGCKPPSLATVRYISSHILAYPATGRGSDGLNSWNSQRDQTPLLSSFEETAFRMSAKIFLSPTHLFATLDDDLYGTRAADNQVKTLSARKADKEGHVADAVADAFFRISLAVRFRRRGESQAENVDKVLQTLLGGRGEQSVLGFVVTADRGYGNLSLLKNLLKQGIGAVMVMPEHLLKCHPFVAESFFNVTRNEGSDEDSSGSSESSDSDNDSLEDTSLNAGLHNQHGTSSTPSGSNHAAAFDRPKKYVIGDDPGAGPLAQTASKKIRALADGSKVPITAVAVRERGTDKYSKVLRFLFSVPLPLQNKLNVWVAVPKTSASRHLFVTRSSSGQLLVPATDSENPREHIEYTLWNRCSVLTTGQRCADWFILRQFRITGTNASKLLLRNEATRTLFGLDAAPSAEQPTPKELLTTLSSGWFTSSRSSEAMKRGTANEGAVMNTLARKEFIIGLYEVGMLSNKHCNWIACSPDGIAILDLSKAHFNDTNEEDEVEQNTVLATVEIKTSVADSSLQRSLFTSSADTVFCSIGDTTFKTCVPEEHLFQVVLQLCVVGTRYGVYVAATETGILRVVVVKCEKAKLDACFLQLQTIADPVVAWAHSDVPTIPPFADSQTKKALKTHLEFWRAVNLYVKTSHAFPPLKLFKHGTQSFYSKTKGGVDGSAQARAVLRSPTSSLQWEQKIVTQTLKTIFINAFIAWRMCQKRSRLESKESFESLEKFRHSLNCVQSLADFSFDCAQGLLMYADQIELQTQANATQGEVEVLNDQEFERLKGLAHRRKRNRMAFFNSRDGRTLRLSERAHEQKQTRPARFCAVCGTQRASGTYTPHRSTFQCKVCDVHLCVRMHAGLRKNCWDLWHSARDLEPRILRPTRVSPATRPREIADANDRPRTRRRRTSSP